MKARVKATEKIVCIERNIDNHRGGYVASDGRIYNACDLELVVDEEPDYWTRLEHQAAIAAMQGILSNPAFPKHSQEGYYKKNVVDNAYEYAHALVEKYKKEEK